MSADLRLYALVDPERAGGRDLPQPAGHAPIEHLDYVCIGGVFATSSKDNPDPPIGLPGLRSIFAKMRGRDPDLPIGAIAGIDATNAEAVIGAGADGIAVISALSLASDPQAAARDLRAIVEAALAKRQAA